MLVPLALELAALGLVGRLPRARLRLAARRVPELLDALLRRDLGLGQLLDLGLALARHREQRLVRLLLRDELLDDLVDVGDAGGLLDLAEGGLVRRDLLLLLLDVRLRDGVLLRCGALGSTRSESAEEGAVIDSR